MAPGFRRLGNVKPAVPNFQLGIGSDHIDMVGRNWRPILDLRHRHRCAAGQNVRHLAFAPRIEVQHNHECTTTVGGHRIEEMAERLDAAGRRADADDRGGLPRQAAAMGWRARPCCRRDSTVSRRLGSRRFRGSVYSHCVLRHPKPSLNCSTAPGGGGTTLWPARWFYSL